MFVMLWSSSNGRSEAAKIPSFMLTCVAHLYMKKAAIGLDQGHAMLPSQINHIMKENHIVR